MGEIKELSQSKITLKNADLNNPAFNQSLKALNETKGLPVKTIYHVSYITKKIDKISRDSRELFLKVIEDFEAKRDEKTGKWEPKDKEKSESFEKEIKDFFEIEHTIDRRKLKPEDFGSAEGLTPKILVDLDLIIE